MKKLLVPFIYFIQNRTDGYLQNQEYKQILATFVDILLKKHQNSNDITNKRGCLI